jgi:hypothetical protein
VQETREATAFQLEHVKRTSCGTCFGSDCEICSCNGQTFSSIQEACVSGARVAAKGACGKEIPTGKTQDGGVFLGPIGCGNSSQCPSGQLCCERSGFCVKANEIKKCANHGNLGCFTNDDCRAGDYCEPEQFCLEWGQCRTKPLLSVCQNAPTLEVCTCSGKKFRNECELRAAGERINYFCPMP